ncbi:hypothetical protein IIA15_04410 [candidate division TA06 bacterium]|nr:hypothetical protein [candidate division TA06 bacterium]
MRLLLIAVAGWGLLFGCGKGEKAEEAQIEKPSEEIPIEKPETTTSIGRGTIVGKVTFVGEPVPPQAIAIDKDVEICGKEKKFSEDLVVSKTNKGLKNVVVTLLNPPESPFTEGGDGGILDQRGCWFYPHIQVIPTGSTLEILNSDGILHNIHTFSMENPPFNKAQPGFKKKMTESFEFPEIIRVKCDAHPWMGAWLVIAEHPYYALTDESGSFRIENAPEGKHTLHFWHEKLGKKLRDVKVTAGEDSKVEIQYQEK